MFAKVTPEGSAPDSLIVIVTPVDHPVVVTMNEPDVPSVNVVALPLVIVGGGGAPTVTDARLVLSEVFASYSFETTPTTFFQAPATFAFATTVRDLEPDREGIEHVTVPAPSLASQVPPEGGVALTNEKPEGKTSVTLTPVAAPLKLLTVIVNDTFARTRQDVGDAV